MEYLPQIITALGTIVLGWFTYNQYSKNKKLDYKIERWKAEETEKSKVRSDTMAKIYGNLWKLLHFLQCDRVYIVQPHPLVNNLFVTITLEVSRSGISPMKPCVQSMQMSHVAYFASEMASRDFMFYKDIDEELKDKKARSIFAGNGCQSVIIKKLSDDTHDWIGSLFCEYTRCPKVDMIYTKQILTEVADCIQYILPEYKD